MPLFTLMYSEYREGDPTLGAPRGRQDLTAASPSSTPGPSNDGATRHHGTDLKMLKWEASIPLP